MSKIKNLKGKTKVSKNLSEKAGCYSDQHLAFSFKYLTTNNEHSEKCFGTGNEKTTNLECLFKKLKELSEDTWLHWQQAPKTSGIETIPFGQLKFKPKSTANLTKDCNIYVFRFDTNKGSNKGRILGFKDSPCGTFYIIGFDYNFSAYDHGS